LTSPHLETSAASDTDETALQKLFKLTSQIEDANGPDTRDLVLRATADTRDFLDQRRQERLRQARATFNAALALVYIGIVVLIAGVILLYSGKTSAGVITTVVGAISECASAIVFKLYQDANDRLDKIEVTLAKIETGQALLEHIEQIQDSAVR